MLKIAASIDIRREAPAAHSSFEESPAGSDRAP